jgi:hypothetical protein
MLHRMLIVALAAALLGPASYAGQGNPQGKDQGQSQGQPQGNPQGQGQGKAKDLGKAQDDSPGNSQGGGHSLGQDHGQGQSGKDNHGQVVSECNHRANDRELKGKERQDFVEWCTDKSERHGFEDWRWHDDRACYDKADKKGLSGDSRRDFIRRCVDRNMTAYPKAPAGGKEHGHDGDKH